MRCISALANTTESQWVEGEALVKEYVIVFYVTYKKEKEEKAFTPLTISESFFPRFEKIFVKNFCSKCRSTIDTDINDNSKK